MVGDRDRAEAALARGREEHLDRRRAVRRVVGVHVQVDVDQRPLRERSAQARVAGGTVAPGRELAVDRLELCRGCRVLVGEQPVLARELALHQLGGRRAARDARVEAPEEALDEAAREQRREQALRGGVERADVQRARVAQRGVGGARCERLVDVDEVELDGAEQFLDGARDVDRQRRRPPARAGYDVEHLADGEDPRLAFVGAGEQRTRVAARGAQRAARVAHPLLRARGGYDQDAMAAPGELARDASDVRVDLVVLGLPRVGRDVGDRERLGHRRERG